VKKYKFRLFLSCVIALSTTLSGVAFSQRAADSVDILRGHFSRQGNNDNPSKVTNNNIYIKFFSDRWIGTLYIPYQYAATLKPQVITSVLEQAKKQTKTSSYLRGKFGHLEEFATVHIEKFGYLEDRIVFECGSLAPCTVRLDEGFIELIKPGVINEHIIRYNHVVDQ
jgi:hypothetical protein